MTTRYLVAAVLVPLLGACRSMQAVPVQFIAETKPAVVYLLDGNGVTQAVANPRLSGDSVLGMTAGNEPVAVPLSRVERVATVRLSRARTYMLVGGIAVVGAVATYAILAGGSGDASDFCDYDRQPTGPVVTECGYPSNP